MTNPPKIASVRIIFQGLVFVVGIPFVPLLISRHWGWWEAWVYAAINIVGFVISRSVTERRHPDLMAERIRFLQHEDAKPWDRRLVPLVVVGGGLIPLVAGLDVLLNWSRPFSLSTKIVALAGILLGSVLASYAFFENRFFSSVVRIQTDRGHQVVTSGPYRWIRHPGYAGGLIACGATPVFLDSSWAFLPAVFFTIVLVIRTELEDRTLQDELAGYREYAERVRCRLLPGVW